MKLHKKYYKFSISIKLHSDGWPWKNYQKIQTIRLKHCKVTQSTLSEKNFEMMLVNNFFQVQVLPQGLQVCRKGGGTILWCQRRSHRGMEKVASELYNYGMFCGPLTPVVLFLIFYVVTMAKFMLSPACEIWICWDHFVSVCWPIKSLCFLQISNSILYLIVAMKMSFISLFDA